MKLYLSSFPALFMVLLSFSLPALHAQAIDDSDERPAIQVTPDFTKYEKDLAKQYPDYFTINPASVKIILEEVKEEPDMDYVKLQEEPPKDLAGIVVTIDNIVNIASKVWQIIQANAPVVNIETKYATAYPQGITSASQLAQWSRPKSYVYGFYAENLYGSVMVDCKYKTTYTYSGSYKGKGKYLTAVTVIPTTISVGWGYRFYMAASVPDSTIANVGTETDPVAAMQLKLTWKMATALKEVDGTSVYYVQGDGFYEEIASPWKVEKKLGEMKTASPLFGIKPAIPFPVPHPPLPVPHPPVPAPATPPADDACKSCGTPPAPETHTNHPHGECKNGHEHYFEYHQGPPPECKCRLQKRTRCL